MRFKIGDKVRVVTDRDRYGEYTIGEISTVSEIRYLGSEPGSDVVVICEGKSYGMWAGYFELVSEDAPKVVSLSEMCKQVKASLPTPQEVLHEGFSIKIISASGLNVQLDKHYVSREEIIKCVNDALAVVEGV